jgi:hypothetical protein
MGEMFTDLHSEYGPGPVPRTRYKPRAEALWIR